jgi:hypothetical protein
LTINSNKGTGRPLPLPLAFSLELEWLYRHRTRIEDAMLCLPFSDGISIEKITSLHIIQKIVIVFILNMIAAFSKVVYWIQII